MGLKDMKLTKSKLRKMIKEEIQKLNEGVWSPAYKGDMQGSAKILEKAFKAAGVKVFKVRGSRHNENYYFVDVKTVDGKTTISIEVNKMSNVVFMHDQSDIKLGKLKENPREIVRTLKKLKKLPGFGQSVLKKK